jgi:galactokinase
VNLASRQRVGLDVSFNLDGRILPGQPKWGNYCKGVAAGLLNNGLGLVGIDILFDSDIPIGGGLSSSAALEVATAFAMLAASGQTMDHYELARLCQKAEHDFANSPCGIMDQAICVMGQAAKALLLDCRDGSVRQIPFDNPDIVVLVADTQVKHSIAAGGYANRRATCYSAAKKLGVEMLRDADEAMLDAAAHDGKLDEEELMRARHVVGEIRRTVEGAEALERGDYARFGELMVASHMSLRNNYETSCAELDRIVDLACACEGAYGARMSGGGFGGCVIVLAEADKASAISRTIASGFSKAYGHPCPIFATRAAAGARLVT